MSRSSTLIALVLGLGSVSVAAAQDTVTAPPAPVQEEATTPPPEGQRPAPLTAPADPVAQVAAMREALAALRERQSTDDAMRLPATPQTLEALQRTEAEIAALESRHEGAVWRAHNLGILSRALAAAPPGALPQGIPDGTKPDIALAVIEPETTLYAAPQVDAQTTIGTVATLTTVLRVAEVGAFSLLWSQQDGFAFVLSHFRKVY